MVINILVVKFYLTYLYSITYLSKLITYKKLENEMNINQNYFKHNMKAWKKKFKKKKKLLYFVHFLQFVHI